MIAAVAFDLEPIPDVQRSTSAGTRRCRCRAAIRDGLPIGMMLVGRWYDEPTIYAIAHAFEQTTEWRTA